MYKTLLSQHRLPQYTRASFFGLYLSCLVLACTLWTLSATAHADTIADPRLARLLVLMQQRLNLAQDVAMSKWNTKAAIDDPIREQQILDALAVQAPQYGLAPKQARDFFETQIVAGKMIQSALFLEWADKQQAPFNNPPDLKNTLRPALDQLTIELLTALAAVQPLLQTSAGRRSLEMVLADPLAQMERRDVTQAYLQAWRHAVSGLGRSF